MEEGTGVKYRMVPPRIVDGGPGEDFIPSMGMVGEQDMAEMEAGHRSSMEFATGFRMENRINRRFSPGVVAGRAVPLRDRGWVGMGEV